MVQKISKKIPNTSVIKSRPSKRLALLPKELPLDLEDFAQSLNLVTSNMMVKNLDYLFGASALTSWVTIFILLPMLKVLSSPLE